MPNHYNYLGSNIPNTYPGFLECYKHYENRTS